MKYKVGDRVRIVSKWKDDGSCAQNWEGKMDKWLGKVMTIRKTLGLWYRMEEDKYETIDGWAWNEKCISGLAIEEKIIIYSDGKTVTAKKMNGKKIEKKAEAKCSPGDDFDFYTGAKLAFERLFEERLKPGDICVVTNAEGHMFKNGDIVIVAGSWEGNRVTCFGKSKDTCNVGAYPLKKIQLKKIEKERILELIKK